MATRELIPRLEIIVAARRHYVSARKAQTPIEAVRALASMQKRPQPVLSGIRGDTAAITLIGQIRGEVDSHPGDVTEPGALAKRLEDAGVDAIALFTDNYMDTNGLDMLVDVVRQVNVPVISEDVVIDEYQVVEARAAGASALLLRSSILEPQLLRSLVSATQRNRMTAVVEASTLAEVEYALSLSPYVIALSSRNPLTGQPNNTPIQQLRTVIPSSQRIMLAESLDTLEEAEMAAALNVDAVLVNCDLITDPISAAALNKILRRSS
ncbi:MAG: hypothetical protein J0L63_21465 [Anaerolineae bacterium]|nr:hypothetical protein [Anaerolineae bacterium]